jgi:hypothetical protein
MNARASLAKRVASAPAELRPSVPAAHERTAGHAMKQHQIASGILHAAVRI